MEPESGGQGRLDDRLPFEIIEIGAVKLNKKSSNHFGISPSDPPAGVPADAL